MNTSRMQVAGVFLAVVLAFGVGVFAGVGERVNNVVFAQTASSTPNLSQFLQAYNLLQQNFVETHASGTIPTAEQKMYGAIAGLTNSYGDPYTVFFPPAQAAIFQSQVSGTFAGVGMQMDMDPLGNIIVTAPLKDSPAQKAGMLSGDIITSINATSTEGMSLDVAVSLIRGPKGTTVALTVQRKGVAEPFVVKIMRDTINIPEINTYKRPDGVYVIQLYTFTANSADLFRDALRQFIQSGSNRLIFDLRGNPGGYLEAAVQMASFFLPVGDAVVTEDFKGSQPDIVHRSAGYNVFAGKNLSMAILVDQGSASASEIFSGALQQHGVAKLVGTRTFGKGSVQQLMDLGGGAQLKITVARWLTPNGTSISDGGLKADIMASTTVEDVKAGKDPAMDVAAQYLLGQ